MNALLRKEVRLLLPSFAAALLLSLGVWLMPTQPSTQDSWRTFLTIFPFLLCPALVVMMALDSFGREISGGTMPHLLAQPIPRGEIWWTKVTLLAGALLVVLAVWSISFRLHFWNQMAMPERSSWKDTMLLAPALFVLVAFSGGLWTVLLLRQVVAAFWFTLIAPSAILLLVMNVTEKHPALFRSMLITALVLYSMAGFFFARRLFLRAQDLQPGGGEIALPRWRAWSWRFASVGEKRRLRPRAALWRKELQLHQSQFVLAGVLLLLHLGVMATRRFVKEADSPALHFITLTFWVLWLFMPLLIGCAAVAEERKLGTLEGQLCLPTTRRRQFIIKLLTTLLLSVLFGTVVPVILEGSRILPAFDPFDWASSFEHPDGYYPQFGPYLGEILASTIPLLGLAGLAGLAALIGTMAFYASSFTRNTLQSLAPAVLGLLLVMTAVKVVASQQDLFAFVLWPRPLAHLLGVPAFVIALFGLMYWNFKRVLVGGMVWRRNALVLSGTLLAVTTVSATLHHRAWEFLSAKETAHGPAVAVLNERTMLRQEGWHPMVQLPDGRVWVGRIGRWDKSGIVVTHVGDLRGAFLEGTNWAKVIATHLDLAGVRQDGSLWVTEQSETGPGVPNRSPVNVRMVRVGTDHDWTDAVTYQFQMVLLLKTDGTLWALGTNHWTTNGPPPSLRTFTPQQLGTNSDWTTLSTLDGRIFLGQRNGGFWVSPKYSHQDTNTLTLLPGLTLYRAPELLPSDPPATWIYWDRGQAQIGVLADGTLRVTGGPMFSPRRAGEKLDPQGYYAPLGTNQGWRSLAGSYFAMPVTLKNDGTIWKWDFPDDPITNPTSAVTTKMSTHADWVAIAGGWSGTLTLARDGSLWLWRLPNAHQDWRGDALLRSSRRPQRLGNIFDTAE